jgi:sterol desaturase/sphingolipid hydroxylase (fatty acid hydroxylase superfamily)
VIGGLHAGYALVPFFLCCLAIEAAVLYVRDHRTPNVGEWLANTGCGVGQLAMRPLYETAIAALYLAVYEHGHVLAISTSSWAAWAALFFATDLTYYAYHRLSHRVPLMWAWHGVHHQSTAYDLSVSFRLSWLGGPVERLFHVPFAIVGFPPAMIVAMTGLSSFYQFFVHTRAVGRLGPLEWIFNTPSHHRVHHGIEPQYVDHNFGGILCIWDRLFRTYVPEGAEPTFGLARTVDSLSPFVANVHHWQELWRAMRERGVRAWRSVLFTRTTVEITPCGPPRRPSTRTSAYVAAQLVVAMATVSYVVATRGVEAPPSLLAIAFAVASTATLGALLDGSSWARRAELARWAIGGVALAVAL